MVRKTILLLLLLSALLFATGVVSAAQEYAAERYDVQIDVQEDSSLWITETVTFRFSGDPFTFVFRTLPTEKTDGISNIQASMDGMPLPIGTQPGQVEINTGDEVEVTWHFQPVSDSTHTFTLQYQAAGVVQQSESADLLEWDVFPAEHEYRIAQGTVMVNYPASAAMVEEPQVFAEGTSIQSGESQLSFSVSNLDEDETATLRLAFAPGSLIAGPPQWQARQMRQRQAALDALPYGLFALLAALTTGVVILVMLWNRNQRDSQLPTGEVPYSSPPKDRPPAVAGVLLDSGSQISWKHAHGTLLDLAQQGVLAIEEVGEQKWYQSSNFHIDLQEERPTLRPHEQGLLRMLFHSKKGPRTQVNLSELNSSVNSQWKEFSAALQEELVSSGLLSPGRKQTRDRALSVGSILSILGPLVLIPPLIFAPSLADSGNDLLFTFLVIIIALSAASFLLGLTTLIMWSSFSPLTDAGEQEAGQWKGFKRHLQEIARGREPLSRPDLFEIHLPYTASFGMAEEWVRFFQKHGNVDIPLWFRPLASANSSESMGALVAIIAASSSVGNSGSSGAGAGGAAGGGASGAG